MLVVVGLALAALPFASSSAAAQDACTSARTLLQQNQFAAAATEIDKLGKLTPPPACLAALHDLTSQREAGARELVESGLAALAADRTDAASVRERAADLLAKALVLDPGNKTASRIVAALGEEPAACTAARGYADARHYDRAESLLSRLEASADDAVTACVKRVRADIAAKQDAEGVASSVADRLRTTTSGTVLPILLSTAVVLLTGLVLWGLARTLSPPSPAMLARHRRLRRGYVAGASVAAAIALTSLARLYLDGAWSVRSEGSTLLVVLATVLTGAVVTATMCWRALSPLAAAAPAAVVGLTLPARWLEWTVSASVLAAGALYALWAGSRTRMSFGDFNGGDDAPSGFAAAIGAELASLGEDRPRGVEVVAGTDQTALPVEKLGDLPGGKWISALVSVWRGVTPSNDLVVTGEFLEAEDGVQSVALRLRRGRRVESTTIVRSRMFGVAADGAVSAADKSAAWHDVATGAAAWLLLQLRRVCAEPMPGLAGAQRWESVALNAVAARRAGRSDAGVGLSLLLRAVSLDPPNLAAQYGRLALVSRQVDAAQPPARARYVEIATELLVVLDDIEDRDACRALCWRVRYTRAALLGNAAVAGDVVDATLAHEAVRELSMLSGELRPYAASRAEDAPLQPLADRLLELTVPAALGTILAMGASASTELLTDVQRATGAKPKSSDARQAARSSLGETDAGRMSPRPAYNAAAAWAADVRALPPYDPGRDEACQQAAVLLRRAFRDPALVEHARRDPYFTPLVDEPWLRALREEFAAAPVPPTGLAAMTAVSPYVDALAAVGISTLDDLAASLRTARNLFVLAWSLGLPSKQLLGWRRLLGLVTEVGLDVPVVNVLGGLGLTSAEQLAGQDIAQLRAGILAVAGTYAVPGPRPSTAQVAAWIAQAQAVTGSGS